MPPWVLWHRLAVKQRPGSLERMDPASESTTNGGCGNSWRSAFRAGGQVYSALKGNIDAAADISGYKRSGVNLDSKMITGRELQVAIPASTTVAQWAQINKAIEYSKSNGVSVKITV
jgi:hypothetical protein